MLFFKTVDTTVALRMVKALSRHGTTLSIHLHDTDKPILSKPEGDWQLDEYTQQWAELLQLEREQREREEEEYREKSLAYSKAVAAGQGVKVPQGNVPGKSDPID